MVYAVDFDGTLSMGEWPEVGPANTNLFDFLKRKQDQGDRLILQVSPLKKTWTSAKRMVLYSMQ